MDTTQVLDTAGLRAAGLYARPDFLPTEACARLRAEMDTARLGRATVASGDKEGVLDERSRRTKGAAVSAAGRAEISQRLAALRSGVEAHFGQPLAAHEPPQFLVYLPGDFFRPHRDRTDSVALPEYLRRRRISVVIFLGRQTRLPEPGSYCGGTLTFFRLPGAVGPAAIRAEVWAHEGLLVAFPSELLHEVRPVRHGRRHSIVSWFTSPDRPAARSTDHVVA